MASKQQFLVVGLGSFGLPLGEELMRMGHDVLGVDSDRERVERAADLLTHAVVADVRDEKVLEELGVADFDGAVVAIGEHLEASILATLHLKAMKVPRVWVKALTHDHRRILARIGADRVILPEHEMGVRIAHALVYPGITDYMPLGDDTYVAEYRVDGQLKGRTLADAGIPDRLPLQVLLLKRGREILRDPALGLELETGDRLVILGERPAIERLARLEPPQ
ncbi:MAG: TrkA family potassium uptake protein [Caenispirillum bisanense]|nr:TrkA family potassium uptake protein [Caenispirillum bisanense]MCA1973164.1 TrkA family potassium uptake protein [Caenispirillum sp.]